MQICDGCGQEVDGGADTCPNCGEDLAPPRTDSRTPVENEKPTDTATDYSLLAALLLGIASWIFLQAALNARSWLDYCESTTFFWLFFFCAAGAVASLLRKLYLVALASTVTVTVVGITFLLLTMSYRLDFVSLVLIAIGILGTSILASSRSEFNSRPESPGKLKDGKGTLKGIGPGGIVQKVLAVLVVVVLLTFVYFSYDDCNRAYAREGYYEVQVSTASGGDYELIVPIPVNESLVVWDLVGSIEIIHGNGSWEVVQTSFGPGLRITGKENVTLRCEDMLEARPFYFLSPQNRSLSEWEHGHQVPFLVYANASGLEHALGLSVVAHYDSSWEGIWATLGSQPGGLVGAWQVVSGSQEHWVV